VDAEGRRRSGAGERRVAEGGVRREVARAARQAAHVQVPRRAQRAPGATP
jgi:hypothetical protein